VDPDETPPTAPVTVRMFGILRHQREVAGEPTTVSVVVPADGVSACELAKRLGLAPEDIEGAFVNHVLLPITCEVKPGDRVGLVPYGTPGPHRFYLGLYDAGKTAQGEEPD
jgi:hypothetical protein